MSVFALLDATTQKAIRTDFVCHSCCIFATSLIVSTEAPSSSCSTYRRQTNRHDLFEFVWRITLRVRACDTICLPILDTICLH